MHLTIAITSFGFLGFALVTPSHSARNDAAIVRLVVALLLEQNDEWQLQRRYMQLEGMEAVSDNQALRVSAVITG